ncbi:MAG: carboxyl transferase domain-containing protein [Actinomycetota bacterium]
MSERAETAASLADPGSFEAQDLDLRTSDPLHFADYATALEQAREHSGADESVTAGPATIGGIPVELATFEFGFLGGSMGEVAGERLSRALERAAERRVPFVLRTSTGGARMQEGMRSLIQMPKMVAARLQLARTHQPYIAILGHPTTGGVLASLGATADVTIAEADATVGFAGPRVAERFTGTPLPPGSHSANHAYTHGLVDELVSPADAHAYIATALKMLAPDAPDDVDEPATVDDGAERDAWDIVEAVRNTTRPLAVDLIRAGAELFVELRGDRQGSDDPAVLCGLARIMGRRAMVIAMDRNHDPGPDGYRKARRCVDIAGRLDIPVVTLVDMRGADPSAESEASGLAWAIAALIETMLQTPASVISIVTGEGGSGGALAFATGDELLIFQDAIFSVIAPEGAAEILWRDATMAPQAARFLRLTATELHDLGIADAVIRSPLNDETVRAVIALAIDRARERTGDDRAAARQQRWRRR